MEDFLDILFVDFDYILVCLFFFDEASELPVLFIMLDHVLEVCVSWFLPILEDSLITIEHTDLCMLPTQLLDV